MNQHDNINREDNQEMTVHELLQQMGIATAVEEFLGNEKINDLLNEVYSAGCLELAELIKTMPASIQDTLNERLGGFEAQVNDYIEMNLGMFRQHLASRLYSTTAILSTTAATKVAYVYQDELDACSDTLMQMMRDLAEKNFEEGKEMFLKSWSFCMMDLENNEDRVALLQVVMGKEIPNPENCMVIPMMAGDLESAFELMEKMFGDGDDEEDDGCEEDDE